MFKPQRKTEMFFCWLALLLVLQPTSCHITGLSYDCIRWDQSGSVCLECFGEKRLWQGRCLIPISGCIAYKADDSCEACEFGVVLPDNSCPRRIPGCATYNSDGSCQNCQPGKEVWGGGCWLIIPGCTGRNFDGSCNGCQAGLMIWNGLCVTRIEHCTQYNQEGCIRCANSGETIFAPKQDLSGCEELTCDHWYAYTYCPPCSGSWSGSGSTGHSLGSWCQCSTSNAICQLRAL